MKRDHSASRAMAIGVVGALGAGATVAFADNTSESKVSVTGQVVRSLELTVVTNLNLGNLVSRSSNPADRENENLPGVEMMVSDPSASAYTLSYNGNSSPDESFTGSSTTGASPNIGSISPAQLQVEGEPNYSYTLTAEPVLLTPDSKVALSITVPSSSLTLDEDGEVDVFLGGKFVLFGDASVGEYSASTIVTVTYD